MTEAHVRRSYAEVADVYIRMFGAIAQVDPEDLGFLERNLGQCNGTVLDAGCGPGHLTAYLTGLGLNARGIDLVPQFIESARSSWPAMDFAVGSMHIPDVPDRSLHGILAWYSLIHCEPRELVAVLGKFHQKMCHGGTLVVGFFEGDDIEPFDHKVTTAYRWPAEAMSKMLSNAGFVEVDRLQRASTNQARPHAALAATVE